MMSKEKRIIISSSTVGMERRNKRKPGKLVILIKNIVRKLNTPKIREKNTLMGSIFLYYINAFFYGGGALVLLGLLFQASMLFMGNYHNVDLAFNIANIKCGFCTSEILDEHTSWDTGEHVFKSLKDSYIDSIHSMKLLFYYSNIGSFFVGVFASVFVIVLFEIGVLSRKYEEWKKKWQK